VFENQLILRAGLEQQREFVETFNAAQQLGAIDKINCYSSLLAPRQIQKTILNILWYSL
jgi:hypothetical protein